MKKKNIIGICCIMVVIIIFLVVSIIIINANDEKKEMNAGNMKSNSSESTEGGSESGNSEVMLAETEGDTGENTLETPVVSTEKWDLTKVNIVYDTNNVPVPVPKGYVASGADGEHTVNTGFVIYQGDGEVNNDNAWDESVSRNQWVWVPVYDSSRIYSIDANGKRMGKLYDYSSTGRSSCTNSNYEPGILTDKDKDKEEDFARYNMIGMTRDKLYKELQVEYDSTIESIEKYGGFYIGRYETGDLFSKIPVVKRMKTSIGNQNWYTMYSKMKYLGANSNVKANMIWGSLWDETLQWLVDSGCKTYEQVGTDSTSWGNYYHATFEYTTSGGSTLTKVNGNSKIPTGSTEYTNANNIYDMAGNVWELTFEIYQFVVTSSQYCACRGGNPYDFGDGLSNLVCRRKGIEPSYQKSYVGFRAYFYIK
ncbi:MAG: hypothetical protein J6J60_06125 [Clostridia bacterium]|nr:hypothetical protein [Clostridia bacterium]